MAQTMLFSSGVNSSIRPVVDFKLRSSLLHTNSSASRLLYNPLPSSSSSSSRSLRAFALFKPRTKAAPKKAPPPKPKVEDGIFGTSGGIGFTKQNELFVGRVAMIGFAVSNHPSFLYNLYIYATDECQLTQYHVCRHHCWEKV
ncbi:hypothetical protein LINPERPRIM_LOCUS13336 [Linum perenne]